jgi:hypothetical protein
VFSITSMKPYFCLVLINLLTCTSSLFAETVTFFNLGVYNGSETLIEFDGAGYNVFDQVHRIGSVEFNLLVQGTLNDTGLAPTLAGAPHSTYNREFAPFNGNAFIQNSLDQDLELRFDIPINTVSAEIRSRPFGFVPETLTFDLYNNTNLLSSTTIADRGEFHFFSYGLQSTVAFNRIVMRNLPDERLDFENLRYANLAIPEPMSSHLVAAALMLTGCLVRRRVATSSIARPLGKRETAGTNHIE